MKIDWDKDTGSWNIREIDSNALIARCKTVRILCESELIATDGGRHGYLIVSGKLTIKGDVGTINRS